MSRPRYRAATRSPARNSSIVASATPSAAAAPVAVAVLDAAAAARGERYDLVVCDSTDCSSRERASGTLYTDAFLLSVKALVGETGSFVRNYTSLLWNLDEAAATLPRYAAVFGAVAPYAWQQPTYSSGSYSALLCGAGAAAPQRSAE